MRQQLFIPLKVFIAAGIATSLFFSQSSTRAGDEPYNPYALQWVSSGTHFVVPPEERGLSVYSKFFADQGSDGRAHVLIETESAVTGRQNIYYVANDEPTGEQQWREPIKLNESPVFGNWWYDGQQLYLPFDGEGNPHVFWRTFGEPTGIDLEVFQSETMSLVYRRQQVGEWLPEQIVEDYQAFQYASDSGLCRSGVYGRQWWAKKYVFTPTVAVESDGIPRFAWQERWVFRPFSSDGMTCDFYYPYQYPPDYFEGYRLLTKYDVGGTRTEIFTLPYFVPGLSFQVVIDSSDVAHLFININQSGSEYGLWYATASPGSATWSDLVQLLPPDYLIIQDIRIDAHDAIHILTYDGRYIRVRDGTVERNEYIGYSYGHGLIVSPDGIVYFNNGGTIFRMVDGERQTIGFVRFPTFASLSTVTHITVGDDDSFTAFGYRLFNTVGEYSRDADVMVGHSSMWKGRGYDDISLSRNVAVNPANGNLSVAIPLFEVQGSGPPTPVSVSYQSLSKNAVGLFSHATFGGWELVPNRRLLAVPHALNRSISILSDGRTHLLSRPDESTSVFTSSADEEQFLRLTQHEDGTWLLEERDGTQSTLLPSGLVDSLTDASGNAVDYQYGDNPSVVGEQQNLTAMVDANGRTTSFEYDERNLLFRATDPSLNTYSFAYYDTGETGGSEENHLLKSITRDGTNEQWAFTYHDRTDGTATCADGSSCPVKRGSLKTIRNPRGFEYTLYYEEGGRFRKATDPSGNNAETRYEQYADVTMTNCGPLYPSGSDLRTTVTDWRGFDTVFDTDFETSAGWRVRNPAGFSTERSYGSHRRQLCLQDRNGNVTTYDWLESPADDFVKYQLERVHQPGVATPLRYTYTAAHEIETVTDPLGNQTQYFYEDARNPHLRTKIIEPEDE